MGFLKKIFRPVRKITKKLIPKEIRPALPFLAAYYGPAAFAKEGIFSNKILTDALLAAGTAAATDEDANLLRTAALAAAPEALSQGLGAVGQKFGPTQAVDFADELTFAQKIGAGAKKGQAAIEGAGLLKTVGAQTAIDQSVRLAEINQDEIDRYNENLRKQGVLDKTKRRSAIFNIYKNAGYDDDYVNSMLDRYGYDEGGLAKLKKVFDSLGLKSPETMAKMSNRLKRRKPEDDNTMIPPKKPKDPEDKDEEEPVLVKDVDKDLAGGLMAAARGVEQAFGRPFGNIEPVPMLRFARGGEVEIEEETEDLGIRDFMRDQGVEYGDQVSNTQNDQILEMLFEKYLEMGLSPKDAAEAAQNEFDRMSRKSDEGIMQMASGYKTDIEEMYEQYVFEMEELGIQPMSFREFVDQARSGMADGGIMSPEEYFEGKRKYQNKKGKEKMRREYEEYQYRMKYGPRDEAKDGGIMEKDMRGGGFIPEGTKERADDVPARLSKNEFVMTADAVRAAGGGSVNKGAKRMYDMMYSLEGKV